MNAVTSIWRQLVRRRLWPVAVLLLAALAAVPVVLAREPDVPVLPSDPAPATTGKPDDTIAEPVVAQVTPEDRSRRRRVLGTVKDPFKPAPVKKAKVDEPKPDVIPDVEPPAVDPGTGSGSGSGSGSGGGTVVPAEPAPKKTYSSPSTIIVRFGEAAETAELERFAIKKMQAVPDDELPLLIYMGLTSGGKKAKFLVDAAVDVDGDGDCKPHRSTCETIELAVGETEFLDVISPEWDEATMTEDQKYEASFQLDLVDIKRAGDDDVK
jgi:hypothetical protein